MEETLRFSPFFFFSLAANEKFELLIILIFLQLTHNCLYLILSLTHKLSLPPNTQVVTLILSLTRELSLPPNTQVVSFDLSSLYLYTISER